MRKTKKGIAKKVVFCTLVCILIILTVYRAIEIKRLCQCYAQLTNPEKISVDILDAGGTTLVYDEDYGYVLLKGVGNDYSNTRKQLEARNISRIKYLVVSADDRPENIERLLTDFWVDIVYLNPYNANNIRSVVEKHVKPDYIFVASAGERIWLAATRTEIVSVVTDIALKVEYGESKFLLAGKSELQTKADLNADILIISKDSQALNSNSCDWMLRDVRPERVVLCGDKDEKAMENEKRISNCRIGERKKLNPLFTFPAEHNTVSITTNGFEETITF